MTRFVRRVALGACGAAAIAGCAGPATDAAEAAARRAVRCVDGRGFALARTAAAGASVVPLGQIHVTDEPRLASGGGDAGFVEATLPLDYAVDARGLRVLAARELCAPGTSCFPANVTAEIYPAENGDADAFSLSLADTFAPYAGTNARFRGRLIALAARELGTRGAVACP